MARVLGSNSGATILNQDIYEMSATQKHRLGTRVQRGDSVYRYAKAGATVDPDMGVWGNNYQCISYAAAPVAAVAGDNKISMTVGGTDGPAGDGVLAANYLENGSVVIFSNTVDTMFFTIKGNTAVASGGGTTILTLDGELPVAIATATSFIEACPSSFADCRTGNSGGNKPFLGMAMRAATTTYPYFWIKTWGPCWLAPQAEVGATAGNNNVVFRHDGSLGQALYSDANNNPLRQHAGYVLTRASAGTQGAPFVYLEVRP
jgi:hypothetical protein